MLNRSPPGTHQGPRHLSSVAGIYCHLIVATWGLFVTSLRHVGGMMGKVQVLKICVPMIGALVCLYWQNLWKFLSHSCA